MNPDIEDAAVDRHVAVLVPVHQAAGEVGRFQAVAVQQRGRRQSAWAPSSDQGNTFVFERLGTHSELF